MNKNMLESLSITQNRERYDECAKRIISNKYILALILKKVIEDFKTLILKEMIPYIENDIKISEVALDPGLTNQVFKPKIIGANSEDSEVDEGMIRYDLLFYVTSPTTNEKMLINIEIQQGVNSKYKMYNREVYYTSRMISSQKNREFIKQNYDNLLKVYSIWLLLFIDDYGIGYHVIEDTIVSGKRISTSNNLFNIIEVALGKDKIPNDEYYDLYYILNLIFKSKLKAKEKIAILDEKYDILFNEEERKDVNEMCNASLGLIRTSFDEGRNEGIEIGEKRIIKQTILNLHNLNLSIEDIAACMNKSIEDVRAIINASLH